MSEFRFNAGRHWSLWWKADLQRHPPWRINGWIRMPGTVRNPWCELFDFQFSRKLNPSKSIVQRVDDVSDANRVWRPGARNTNIHGIITLFEFQAIFQTVIDAEIQRSAQCRNFILSYAFTSYSRFYCLNKGSTRLPIHIPIEGKCNGKKVRRRSVLIYWSKISATVTWHISWSSFRWFHKCIPLRSKT